MKNILLLLLLQGIFISNIHASHFMGGDVNYECLGAGEYLIEVTIYRDCNSIISFEDTLQIDILSNDCFYDSNPDVYLKSGFPISITPLCESEVDACDSDAGTYGVEEFVYSRILVLPQNCDEILVGFSNCCRNSAISTLEAANQEAIYIGATIDTKLCNSSPRFNNNPTPFICVGQQVNYNHGVTDAEGDDLVFSLVSCANSPTGFVDYVDPYSGTNPLESTGMSIDPTTGAISFIPVALQVGVLCVRVEEFREGVKIGEIYRDIQFTVLDCESNSVDGNIVPVLSGMNGTADAGGTTGGFLMDLCYDETICFSLESYDGNGDNLELVWNGNLDNAELNITGNGTDNLSAEFCWTPTIYDTGLNFFTITIMDDACDIRGINTYTFSFNVNNVNLDYTYTQQEPSCTGLDDGSATIIMNSPLDNPTFTWPTIPPQNGLSAENLSAGTYAILLEDASLECESILITVTITEDDSIAILPGANSREVTCGGGNDGILDIEISGGDAPYDIIWPDGSSATILSDLEAGSYTVTVTDDSDCETSEVLEVSEPELIIIDYIQSYYDGYGVSCTEEDDGFINISVSGGIPPFYYEWDDNIIEEDRENLLAGTYTLTVTDAKDCQESLEVTLAAPEVLSLELDNIPPTCFEGNDGSIIIEGVTGGIPPYSWSRSSNTFIPIDVFPIIIPNQTKGEKTIYFKDAGGCSYIYTVEVEAPDSLFASVVPNDISVDLGESVDISFLTNSVDSFDFFWTSTEPMDCDTCPFFNYFPTENYTEFHINIIEKTNGCTAKGIGKVNAREKDFVFVPNVFSPNGDGRNDLLNVHGNSNAIQSIVSFHVFNRWGEEVFQLNNFEPNTLDIGWNGNINGEKAPTGVYIYTLDILYINGKKRRVSGDATLLR